MKLKDYRNLTKLSVVEAAQQTGVTPECWRYWENGQKIPSRENMSELFLWSLGNVTPNDFYSLPPVSSPARSCANDTHVTHAEVCS